MTVAHDAATDADAGSGVAGLVVHTPVGTPRAVLGFYMRNASTTDVVTGMTYGGVAMSRVAFAVDTATEVMAAWVYFLGASVPTGTQTLAVTVNDTSLNKEVGCVTMTAAADCEIADFDVVQGDAANPQVALDSGAASALRYVGIISGLANVGDLAVLTGMTDLGMNRDIGTVVCRFDRQTTASTGSFTIGYTAASDDVALVAVAVKEIAGAVFPWGEPIRRLNHLRATI